MNDLIRRALLGDLEARKECNQQGIALPCPFCIGTPVFEIVSRHCTSVTFEATYEVKCSKCGMAGIRSTSEIALKNGKPVVYRDGYMECLTAWNMRVALPIGRCETCKNKRAEHGYIWCLKWDANVQSDYYCKGYEEVDHEAD